MLFFLGANLCGLFVFFFCRFWTTPDPVICNFNLFFCCVYFYSALVCYFWRRLNIYNSDWYWTLLESFRFVFLFYISLLTALPKPYFSRCCSRRKGLFSLGLTRQVLIKLLHVHAALITWVNIHAHLHIDRRKTSTVLILLRFSGASNSAQLMPSLALHHFPCKIYTDFRALLQLTHW